MTIKPLTMVQYARDMWLAGLEPSQIVGNLSKFPAVKVDMVASVLIELERMDRATSADFDPRKHIRRPHA